jgi:hypothetical protein
VTIARRFGVSILVLALAACGGDAASPTPAPTDTPAATATATPTAAPDNVAAAFLARMADLDAVEAALEGTLDVAGVRGRMSGELRTIGADSYNLIEVAIPGAPTERTETISVGGDVYERRGEVWVESQAAVDNPLSLADSQLRLFTEAGTDTVGGEPVVRLEHAGGIELTPADLGLPEDPTMTDFVARLAFLVTEDGEPVALEVTADWNQEAEGTALPVSMDFMYRFTRLDEAEPISPPEQVWAVHASDELGYTMAHPLRPSRWDVSHEPAEGEFAAFDLFLGPVDEEIQVILHEVPAGVTATGWMRESLEIVEAQVGPVETDEELTIAGLPARIFTALGTGELDGLFFQEAVIFADGVAWDVDWYSDAGSEEADMAMFRDFLSTFAAVMAP